MKSVGEKIKKARLQGGLKQKDFAAKLGLTPQAISGWERGVTYPQVELYKQISSILNVSTEWLFFDGENKVKDDTPNNQVFNVPFYSEVEVSAGNGFYNEYSSVEWYPLPKQCIGNQNNKESIICIRCNGDSMEPIILNDAILAVNTSIKNIHDGSVYIIKIFGALRVKVLYLDSKGIRIKSYNEKYPDECVSIEMVKNNSIEIVGKVFWFSTCLK
jgi:phage repressor protein C with HTH and peptisase S24 domain